MLGYDANFHSIISKVFENAQVKSLLSSLHGDHYKVTQVNIREAFLGDLALNFHQDYDGETGIGILLDDCRENEGTTVFIPGSHKWPFSIRELFIYPRIFIPLIPKEWVSGAQGKSGDIYFFINRVWHARPTLGKNIKAAAILISIFGSNRLYRIHEFSGPHLESLPQVLRELVDHRAGVTELSDGRVRVDQSQNSSGIMSKEVFKSVGYSLGWKLLIRWVSLSRYITTLLMHR